MSLIDLRIGRLKIPAFTIATVAAGFYIGYNEGKGINTGVTLEYLTKYGPTAFAALATPLMVKMEINNYKKKNRRVIEGLLNGKLKIPIGYGTYREMTREEKKRIIIPAVSSLIDLESLVEKTPLLKTTVMVTGTTAIEAGIGYIAGRLYSQLS